MAMTLYMTGLIWGDHDYNGKFAGVQKRLEAAGYIVLNPCPLVEEIGTAPIAFRKRMQATISMMFKADGVAALNDFIDAEESKILIKLAEAIKIPIGSVDEWIKRGVDRKLEGGRV